MPNQVLSEFAADISELQTNPMKVVASAEGMPIAILNRNEPAFYCIPAKAYQALLEHIDDIALLEIAIARKSEDSIQLVLDEL